MSNPREDGPEALGLDDAPVAVAMRAAYAATIGPVFVPWTQATATKWPHPDRAVRDRFHADWNRRLYEASGIDPMSTATRHLDELTGDEKEAIVAKRRDGSSIAELCADYHVNDRTLHRFLASRGLADKVRRLTTEEVALMIARYTAGDTANQIARAVEIHEATVYKVLRREGVTIRGTGPKQASEARAKVTELHALGQTDAEIALAIGVTKQRVTQLRHLLRLSPNRPPTPAFDAERRRKMSENAKRQHAARAEILEKRNTTLRYLAEKGHDVRALAAQFGMTAERVTQIVRRRAA